MEWNKYYDLEDTKKYLKKIVVNKLKEVDWSVERVSVYFL